MLWVAKACRCASRWYHTWNVGADISEVEPHVRSRQQKKPSKLAQRLKIYWRSFDRLQSDQIRSWLWGLSHWQIISNNISRHLGGVPTVVWPQNSHLIPVLSQLISEQSPIRDILTVIFWEGQSSIPLHVENLLDLKALTRKGVFFAIQNQILELTWALKNIGTKTQLKKEDEDENKN